MKLLSLGLTDTTDEVRLKLQHDCITLKQEGFRVAIDEINKGSYTFLGCNVIEGELSFRNYERIKDSLKNYVAVILAEFIMAHEEEKIIRRIVEQNYYYFSEAERTEIYANALYLLQSGTALEPSFNYTARREFILRKLTEYLDTHHELVVEGFIHFRLKEYREKLTQLVDKAVDDFMMEVEHQEFISVLRYFVDIQDTQVEEVHVVVTGNDTYRILDSQGRVMGSQYLESFATRSNGEINYEDLLITALITIAPYHIILHNTGKAGLGSIVETIKSVFEGRVMVCAGCELCLAGLHIDSVDR